MRATWLGPPLARAVWGMALVVFPDRVGSALGVPITGELRTAARVLGGRDVAQAAVTMTHPTAATVRLGVAVDLLHAASVLAEAVRSPQRRRASLTSGSVALGFAAAGVWAGGR